MVCALGEPSEVKTDMKIKASKKLNFDQKELGGADDGNSDRRQTIFDADGTPQSLNRQVNLPGTVEEEVKQ